MKWWLFLTLLLTHPLVAKEPRLSCERKFGKINWQGMEFHRYRLRAENFPPEQTFRLIVKSFDGTQTETFKYHSNKRGHLILESLEGPKSDIYAVCPAKRGERLTFLMKCIEEDKMYIAELVPFPLEMRSKKGIKLNLELQGEQGEKFLFSARGFKSKEEVRLFLHADGKEIDLTPEITQRGDLFVQILLPMDSDGGEAKLILSRKNEEVVFLFEWGGPALKLVGACCFEIK